MLFCDQTKTVHLFRKHKMCKLFLFERKKSEEFMYSRFLIVMVHENVLSSLNMAFAINSIITFYFEALSIHRMGQISIISVFR